MDIIALIDEIEKIDDLGDAFEVSEAIDKKIEGIQAKDLSPLSEYGDLYTLEEFYNAIKAGCITSCDGFGYYATKDQESRLEYRFGFSRFLDEYINGKYGFTHVIWFNK